MAEYKKVEVTLVKSMIGSTDAQIKTLRGLGLRRVGKTRAHVVTPPIKGMLDKVAHLVSVKDA
jgi:large subunit ribosomal protein L30